MRVGELAALHWSDVDDDFIHINYSEHRLDYSCKKSELEIGEPKNGKHRVIQMTDAIEGVFQKVKALEQVYTKVYKISDYLPEEKKTGSA